MPRSSLAAIVVGWVLTAALMLALTAMPAAANLPLDDPPTETPAVTETPTWTPTPDAATATPTPTFTATAAATGVDTLTPTSTGTPDAATATMTFTPTASPTATPPYALYLPWVNRVAPGAPGEFTTWFSLSGPVRYVNWTPSEGAVWYELVHRHAGNRFTDQVIHTRTPGDQWEQQPVASQIGENYYTVRAYNAWGMTTSNTVTYSVATPVPTQTPSPTPTPPTVVGRLMYNCSPLPYVRVLMRRVDGEQHTTVAETLSDHEGLYRFAGLPYLQNDSSYYVVFPNAERNSNYVGAWVSRRITFSTTFALGPTYRLDDIQTRNVRLLRPTWDSAVRMPARFEWTTRRGSDCGVNDYYVLRFILEGEQPRAWLTRPLADTSVTLGGLATGMTYNQAYVWTILINYSSEYPYMNGWGVAYDNSRVTFLPGGDKREATEDEWLTQLEELGRPAVGPLEDAQRAGGQ